MPCLAPWPLSLVLQIVVRDFEAVFSESQKDLIADRHAVIGVATTQLLEHSFGDLGRQGDFRRTPADRRRRQLKVGGPFRDRVQIRHPHPALPDALDKVVMGFELLRTSKTGVVGDRSLAASGLIRWSAVETGRVPAVLGGFEESSCFLSRSGGGRGDRVDERHHFIEESDEALRGIRPAIVQVGNVGGVGHFLPYRAITEGGCKDMGPYPRILFTQEAFDPWTCCSGACAG